MEVEKKPRTFKSILKKTGRILLRTVLVIILLLITILILIQTPPVQSFIVKKATAYLSHKLHTRIEIGKLYIGFPKNVVIENVYVEDQKRDTLLSGGSLKVDISMLKLLHNEIEINDINLDNITAKIKRVLPDTAFNFQFIIDSFSSENKKPEQKDTSTLKMNIKYVQLDNIRMVYKDAITGNDVDIRLRHFDTKIDKFDLNHQQFDVPVTTIRGVSGFIHQSVPLTQPEVIVQKTADAGKPSGMQLNFRKLLVNGINIDYNNDASAMSSSLNLGELVLNAKRIDLDNRIINLSDLDLSNTTAAVRMGKTAQKSAPKAAGTDSLSATGPGWRVVVSSIKLDNNNLRFDDDNKPRQASGMDYAHVNAQDVSLHLDNLLYSTDSISGSITKAQLKEQSGFQLVNWQTDFLYGKNEAYLKNLLLQTPGTQLSRSVVLHYPSIEAVQAHLNLLEMDVDLHDSKIQLKDILTFVPTLRSQPAFANSSSTLYMNGRIKGSMARLQLEPFQLRGFRDTRVNVSGTITGLPDVKKAGANLIITELSTSRSDIAMLAPKGSIPSNITVPERIKLTGRITGGMNNMNPDLLLTTTLGSASVKGTIQHPSDSKLSQYNVVIETRNLNLGTILQNQQNIGTLSARFVAKGRGYDPKSANASITGVIQSAIIKKYNYRNLQLTAGIANQNLTAKASIQDPNIDITLDASGSFKDKFPAIRLTANVDSIKTLPLHLTTDSIIYRGLITADFPVTDPDHLNGNLFVTKSLLVKGDQRIQLDTLQMSAGTNDSGQFIRLSADAVALQIQGQYRLTQLGAVFQQAIQPYFAVMEAGKVVKTDPYNFTLTGSVINKPILKTFVPGLDQFEPIIMNGHFTSTNGWDLTMRSPLIIYGDNKINDLLLQAGTGQGALGFKATVQQLTSGKSIALYGTSLNGSIANNQIDFTINIKDKTTKDKYRFSALFRQPAPGDYVFSLKPQELLLNYNAWVIPGDNQISILKSDINARNFVLTRNNQQLSINSVSQQANSPMEVSFDNFQVATLANFVQSDSLLADGTLNGKVLLNNLTAQPTFTSDLTISNVSVKKDTIGDVRIKVNNTVANTFAADVNISGHGNDIQLTGNYYVKPDTNSSFDLSLDIRQILLSSVQGATMGAITNASGALKGKFAFSGTLKKPVVNGNLDFNKAAFNLSMLNSYFRIDDESITVNNDGVRFNTFTIKDSANNSAVLDGMVYTNGLSDYKFDLTLKADNFRALNTSKTPTALYYGQLYFNSNLRIRGTQLKPVVDGSLTINDNTKLTVVLPQKQPGVESREGIVEFVDFDAVPNDSLFLARYDSINKSQVLGLDVSVNINVQKQAEFNLIVDAANGDFLKVRGQATLSAGIDPSGKITMAGSYELEEGAYQLSFNFLQRKFNIQKGSTITWTGEPTKANIDITAVYIARTAPLDLVGDQLEGTDAQKSYYRQQLPFEVDLIIKGELMQPQLTFDIVLPPDKDYNVDKSIITTVDTKLEMIRQEPSELNKQVFALLLLGRFVSENPFQSSGGGTTAEGFARASVSKLLTEQLNKLASDLVKGVDINFDVASTDNDYSTGDQKSRTDLNVALSKRLLNDRLTVTIGSSFALEGASSSQPGAQQQTNNLAGNVNIDYKLSKDGRYALRAYRKNEYEGVLDGYIIETGVGFVITVDYNTFKQIFLSKKQRMDKRALKKQNNKPLGPDDKKSAEADDPKKDVKTVNAETNE